VLCPLSSSPPLPRNGHHFPSHRHLHLFPSLQADRASPPPFLVSRPFFGLFFFFPHFSLVLFFFPPFLRHGGLSLPLSLLPHAGLATFSFCKDFESTSLFFFFCFRNRQWKVSSFFPPSRSCSRCRSSHYSPLHPLVPHGGFCFFLPPVARGKGPVLLLFLSFFFF